MLGYGIALTRFTMTLASQNDIIPGYETPKLYQGLKMGASAIILDAGSTDSGPQKLALGEGTNPHSANIRDLGPILDACFHHKVKVLISSAGGDGSNQHVDEIVGSIKFVTLDPA